MVFAACAQAAQGRSASNNGAQAVLCSLCSVGDHSCIRLTTTFYQKWHVDQHPVDEALRRTMLGDTVLS